MLTEYGVWLTRLGLTVVFGLSAWGKLADRAGTRKAVADFGVSIRWVPAVAWALPAVELIVAVAALPPWTAPAAAILALVLLAVFTAAIVRLLRQGKRPACSCFGAMSAEPIGGRTIARNAVLVLLVVLVGVGAIAYPRVPGGLRADDATGLAALAVLIAVVAWLFGEIRALRRRVDEQALSTLGAEGLPPGAVAPEFELLPATGGARVGLESLLASGKSLLMVFVHPGCEMCAALARELPRWQLRNSRSLTIVVVGNGDIDEHVSWAKEQGLEHIPVLVQQGNEAALRYRVRGTPSGVLIGADGRIAAPVARGAMAVRELVVQSKTTVRQ